MNFTDLRKNAEGYDDPTAYEAIMRADADLARQRGEDVDEALNREFNTREKKCPICGKIFIPAPQHAWKIGERVKNKPDIEFKEPPEDVKKVCSYSCMRKWEKANGREK